MKKVVQFFISFSFLLLSVSADGACTTPTAPFCVRGPAIGVCADGSCDGGDGSCYCTDCDLQCGACKMNCTTTAKPTTTATILTTPTTTVNPSCTDSSTSCSQWVPSGFCSNPGYTDKQKKQYCAKSCNLCNCNDNSAQCDQWVPNGFCTNPSYPDDQKRQYCALSCSLCLAGTAAPATTPGNCKDNSASCPTWVANGFCKDPHYTDDQKRQYCAKSCNLC